MAEIVTAIKCMHEQGIMHRDLKPENIMIDKNYHLKIVSKNTQTHLQQASISDCVTQAICFID